MTDTTTQAQATAVPARSDLAGSLLVIVASACWGTSGIFVKLITVDTGVSAISLAFWRDTSTFAVLFLGLVLFRRDWLRVARSDLPWLVGMGASLGIFHVFWNLNVFINGVAVATVQQAAMPAIVTVAAWLLWHESLSWSKIVAIVLTFAGTVLVSGLDVLGESQLTLIGLLVGFGTPTFYASWNLFGKKARQTNNPVTSLTYTFGFGALILFPLQFFTSQPFPVGTTALLWFVALIGLSTIIPFTIYTFALGRLPASVASILAMSEIAFVAVYAYVLLQERLTASQILGAALVVTGVLLLSWYRWRTRGERQRAASLRLG
jgi:drug/metabolite transporter (DMT)-like permease